MPGCSTFLYFLKAIRCRLANVKPASPGQNRDADDDESDEDHADNDAGTMVDRGYVTSSDQDDDDPIHDGWSKAALKFFVRRTVAK